MPYKRVTTVGFAQRSRRSKGCPKAIDTVEPEVAPPRADKADK